MFFLVVLVPVIWFMEKVNEPFCDRGPLLDRSIAECARLGKSPGGGK